MKSEKCYKNLKLRLYELDYLLGYNPDKVMTKKAMRIEIKEIEKEFMELGWLDEHKTFTDKLPKYLVELDASSVLFTKDDKK